MIGLCARDTNTVGTLFLEFRIEGGGEGRTEVTF